MFRLIVVSCLYVSFCVSKGVSRPFNGTSNSTQWTSNSTGLAKVSQWWETLASLDFTDLEKYVPDNVKKFAYDTYEDGKDMAYDLYTDIHEEVVNKTQSNVDDFSKFIENLVAEVEGIQEEEYKLFLQEEPQSREQIEKRKKEDEENKMTLRGLADKIKEEMNKDEESEEPLERAIQQFITYCRSIISSQFYSTEYIWSKVRQAEGTSYQALELIARNANTLKDLVKDLFKKLSTIDISISNQRNEVRKDGFKDNPSVLEELDLVEDDDQFTHMITLDDAANGEEILNVFKLDDAYVESEEKYKAIKKELLDEDSGDSDSGSGSGSESDSDSEDDEEATAAPIIDNTETNLISLRRTIYLTIQSSLDFEEAVHKLLKLNLKPGQEAELCHMIIDCCAQQRTYEKFFGLMGQRFCQVNRNYVEPFMKIFGDTYGTVHRLETGKLRNVSKFFAHLLYTDAIGWQVLSVIKLNEDDTTSSSRIFIKILFQELAEFIGLGKLNERCRDATLQEAFDGLFPRDNPRDTRFAINFFTSIGLGGLTEDLRSHLKTAPKPTAVVAPMMRKNEDGSSSSSSSDSSSSDSSDSSSDSDGDKKKKKKRKKSSKKKKKKSRR